MRSKEIPLKIELISNDDENDFLITSPKEIVSILQDIVLRKSRVAMYYNEGNSMVLTMILAADENGGVWVDAASDARDNRNIERSSRIILVSTHNQAKVQFIASHAMLGMYENAPAFGLALPRKLLRLQRRDYYRLLTPEPNALRCIIHPIPGQEDIRHEVTVMDISIGGVALVCEESGIELQPGMVYEHCRIDLPGIGTLETAIEVKNAFEVTERNGKVKRRVGCVFVKPDGTTTMLLQRYVAQMQQQQASRIHAED